MIPLLLLRSAAARRRPARHQGGCRRDDGAGARRRLGRHARPPPTRRREQPGSCGRAASPWPSRPSSARSRPSTRAGASSCSSSRSWSPRRPRLAFVGAGRDAARSDGPFAFSRLRVGAVAGTVRPRRRPGGRGRGFLLVPLLLVVADIPIRVTIGSSLAITALAAISGFTGKLVTGQIPLAPTLAVVAGAIPGARARRGDEPPPAALRPPGRAVRVRHADGDQGVGGSPGPLRIGEATCATAS